MMFKMKTKFKTLFEINPDGDIDTVSASGENHKSMALGGSGSGEAQYIETARSMPSPRSFMQKMNSAPSKLVKMSDTKNAHFSQALPAKENRLGNIAEETTDKQRYTSSFATSDGSSSFNDAQEEKKELEGNHQIGPIKCNLLPEVHDDSKHY